jgi:hypothetical protein
VAQLLAQHRPDAATAHALHAQVSECPNKDSEQIQKRCDSYCPDLVRLFRTPAAS